MSVLSCFSWNSHFYEITNILKIRKCVFFQKKRPISVCGSENLRKEKILLTRVRFFNIFPRRIIWVLQGDSEKKPWFFVSILWRENRTGWENNYLMVFLRFCWLRHFLAKWRILAPLLTSKSILLVFNENIKSVY